MKTFIKAIMAGIAISIGGTIYLTLENHIAGAFLFSIGLFTIYTFGLNLYTGKVCYIPNEKPRFLLTVLIVILGNAVGTVGTGYLYRGTKLVKLVDHTSELVSLKLSDTLYSTFIMAVFCGIMMCIAVIGFQTIKDSVGKHLALILPIMVFILSGFEHSIADMFYFSLANAWNGKAFVYIIVIALGNLVGGSLLPLAIRVLDNEKLGSH
ncbi:formate/nitrite transporter family protein [Anaerocolumna sp. AGMB13025]|uniref:formate/nitrite transporter family protein n=1 Tax=Anaerocolumna sp. AGMB13025 TaxID=3039116 RepID=UPI00241F7188|nr:formate/nitrite transporter family protein [Anaerocolumna sp. AGMB13025]WFR57836.1 formate/nitrite transporter family protein [Anaerocolumna sp. AGMB13025]